MVSYKSKIKMNCYIYARVSSLGDRQNTERQVVALSDYAKHNGYNITGIYEEHISGASKDKKILSKCLSDALINKTDIILFSELSRCGRAIWEVLACIKYCIDNNIDLYFQKEGLRLFKDGKVNSVMAIYISCLSFCAEKERENIYYRLSQGRELAKSKGIKMGRKQGSVETRDHIANKHKDVIKCLKKKCSIRDTAKICGVGISTVQRVKKTFCL